MTPNEYLTRTAPLERVEHRVCAAVPDERIRELLGLPDGEPVLRMPRRTWSRSRLVSHAWLTHPGSRFALSAAFSLDDCRVRRRFASELVWGAGGPRRQTGRAVW